MKNALNYFVIFLSLLFSLMGGALMAKPIYFERVTEFILTPPGFYSVIGFRLIYGLSFLLAFKSSRLPKVTFSLGCLFLISATTLFFMGTEGLSSWIEFLNLTSESAWFLGLIALILGILFSIMFLPKRSED